MEKIYGTFIGVELKAYPVRGKLPLLYLDIREIDRI
jgi:hypothetical protein